MWLFTETGAVSIVANTEKRGTLLVRARRYAHLSEFLGSTSARIYSTPNADYGYRAVLTYDQVSAIMEREVKMIDYPNFKGRVDQNAIREKVEAEYASSLHRIWGVFANAMQPGRFGRYE